MPRKSASDNATPVLRLLPGEKPPPPPELSGEQIAVWTMITGAMPSGFFSTEMFPVLVALCRSVVYSREAAAWLDAHPAAAIDAKELAKHKYMSALHEMHSRLVASLSTKLRLTPQSRYHSGAMPSRFGRGADGGPRLAKKPWEMPSA